MKFLLPDGWAPPIGYANGIAVNTGESFSWPAVGWEAQRFVASDLDRHNGAVGQGPGLRHQRPLDSDSTCQISLA